MPRPGPLRGAALVLAVEAAALCVLTVLLVVGAVSGRPDSRMSAVLQAALALLAAGALSGLSFAVDRGLPVARSPVVVLQVLAVPVGYELLVGSYLPYGAVVLLLALAELYALATPEARLAFRRRPPT